MAHLNGSIWDIFGIGTARPSSDSHRKLRRRSYGLLGLSIRNHAEFNMAVEIYKARKGRPESQTTGSFNCFRAEGEMVTTQSGCIISTESRDKVAADIQSSRFDKLLNANYQSNQAP